MNTGHPGSIATSHPTLSYACRLALWIDQSAGNPLIYFAPLRRVRRTGTGGRGPLTAASRTSRNRSCSPACNCRKACGGSKRLAISPDLVRFPLAVTIRTFTRRSAGLALRTTSPLSSRRSVGSTTVDGLHWRRAASCFCEMGWSGSSLTSAQADTGERPAAAAAVFTRSSQPPKDSMTRAHSSCAREGCRRPGTKLSLTSCSLPLRRTTRLE